MFLVNGNFCILQVFRERAGFKATVEVFQNEFSKKVPNSLIILVGMPSDFGAFCVFNFLINEVTLSVLKILLDFFICSLITNMLEWASKFVNTLSIVSLFRSS